MCDQEDFCENCLRHDVDTDIFNSLHFCQKGNLKYNNMNYIRGRDRWLCAPCEKYIMGPSKVAKKNKDYWPAMFCCYLFRCDNVDPHLKQETMKEKWCIVPSEWRVWWLEEAQSVDQELTLLFPEPKFTLATHAYEELMDAIGNLEWLQLSKAIDKYLSHPGVRCPFGCSEFLHKTNQVSFEDLLTIRSNGRLNSYSDSKKPSWIVGMKPNFPSRKAILDDSDFWCNPCVVVDPINGLQILTCRYHSKANHYAYLHVPESPTGTLSTPNANRFAPAKLKTRTVRPARLNGFSDTYELAMLQGGFDGIDSTYISTTSRYDAQDELANRRDCLSISGRDDIYYHVMQLGNNQFEKNYLPQRNVDEKLRMAGEMFGDVSLQCEQELAAATFIPLSQAIDIQDGMYNETAKVITVYTIPRINTDRGTVRLYTPKWPTKLVGVHANDGYGCRFNPIKDKLDSFTMWIVVGAVVCVPELWMLMANMVKDNISPYGFIMALAWKIVNKSGTSTPTADPFSLVLDPDSEKSKKALRDVLGISGPNRMKWIEYVRSTFEHEEKVAIVDGEVVADDIPATAIVMIVTDSSNENSIPSEFIGNWELRFVTYEKRGSEVTSWDGMMFARHGNDIGDKWWKQQKKSSPFWKASNCGHPLNYRKAICVYVKNNPESYIELRKRYFATMNGQSTIYCQHHKLALITNYDVKEKNGTVQENRAAGTARQPLKCCYDGSVDDPKETWAVKSCDCESRQVQWICPRSGCGVAVCTKHLETVIKRKDNQMYLLSKESFFACHAEDLAYSFAPQTNHDMREVDDDNDYFHDTGNSHHLIVAPPENEVTEYDHGPTEGFDTADMLYEDHGPNHEEDNEHNNEENYDYHFDSSGYYSNMPFHQSGHTNNQDNDFTFEGPEEISSVPFHVLSNKQGHMLTRQDAKLRMNKKHENVQQKLCATSAGKTLPLVYAEALLFPDIFFKSQKDGTILGAIPTGLWADASVLHKYGVASMKTHAQTRIFDPALLCSTDSRYHFMMFDCLANLGLRGHDSRVVLHRGFAEKQGQTEGVAFKNSDGNNEIYGETVDDQANVHKLCALTGQSMPHFFITQSCNQQSLRGLRIFRKWLQDEKAVQNVMNKHGVDHADAKKMLRLSACVFIERTWNVVSDLWMKYIFQSKEQPLGPIEWAWWRKEFQDETGNVSHIHGIAKSKLDTSQQENVDKLQNMIRGNLADLVHYEEAVEYERLGYIDSLAALKDILSDAAKYLPHTCHSRCQVPRMQPNGETSYYCKVPNNYLMTPTPQRHTMQEIQVDYSPRAMKILVELGLATYSNDSLTVIEITEEKLKMKRHIPKTSNGDEKFSPTNGLLFILYPSSQNLQYCTGMSINSYLTKYAAGVDKVSILTYAPPTRGTNGQLSKVKYQSLNNTKITSVNIHNAKRRRLDTQKRKAPQHTARLFTHPELASCIAGETLVTSTVEFILMQTSPREFRASTDKKKRSNWGQQRPEDMINAGQTPNILKRVSHRFPVCRRFSNFQKMVIQDELDAPLKLDQVTLFSIRPPELRFVNKLSLYTEWFVRKPGDSIYNADKSLKFIDESIHPTLSKSMWIDGFNGVVKIRAAALVPCLNWARSKKYECYGKGIGAKTVKKDMVMYIFKLLKYCRLFVEEVTTTRITESMKEEWVKMKELHLVYVRKKQLPVVWITPVYPRRKHAFLIQLLLSFGTFETEYELMLSNSLKTAFEKAGLLDKNDPNTSLHNLMRLYVDKHLRTFPGSRYQFSRCLIESFSHLQHLFLGEDNTDDYTPSILNSHMMEDMDDKIMQHIDGTKSNIIKRTHEDLVRCGFENILPSVAELGDARTQSLEPDDAIFFPPQHEDCPNQQQTSYEEQRKVMLLAKSCIEKYINPSSRHMNLIICGGPGVGKTTVCQLTCIYILSRGLNMITTSLVARRSKELGGIHYHRLLSCLDSGGSFSAGRQAEKTLSKLYRRPHVVELLRSLDCLFVDELGLFSAEQMAVLDIILRYIKRSNSYMGGIFVFGTIDVMQLMTFNGTPFLMSGFILTDYRFIELKHSVRAANDPVLQEICNMTRLRQWTQANRDRFRFLVGRNCNFLRSFNDTRLPEDAIFVFGKKAPCREAENIMLNRMKLIHRNNYLFSKSVDQESTTAGNWRPASVPTQNILNNRLKRKQELMFYPRARYEFTYNNEKEGFMQGQLAYLLNTPLEEDILNNRPVRVYAGPPGCKDYPSAVTEASVLEGMGWYEVSVAFATSKTETVSNGIQGRRSQYGLRPRVASTIHAAMGSTLPCVVTALVPINGSTSDFGLWDPAQVVVLLSRTGYTRDLYFIGDKDATIKSLLKTLQSGKKNLQYINELLDKLCVQSNGTPTYHIPSRYCSQDAVVPNSPGVYVLASTKQPDYLYIGQTKNLRDRLNTHNQGMGPACTRHTFLRPWGMLGFVTGFQDVRQRLKFESVWKLKFRSLRNTQTVSADRLLNVATEMCQTNNNEESNPFLRFVKTGRINNS